MNRLERNLEISFEEEVKFHKGMMKIGKFPIKESKATKQAKEELDKELLN